MISDIRFEVDQCPVAAGPADTRRISRPDT
jgi:hypothetical protein